MLQHEPSISSENIGSVRPNDQATDVAIEAAVKSQWKEMKKGLSLLSMFVDYDMKAAIKDKQMVAQYQAEVRRLQNRVGDLQGNVTTLQQELHKRNNDFNKLQTQYNSLKEMWDKRFPLPNS